MYNAKIYCYKYGYQLRLYDAFKASASDVPRNVDLRTGEILPPREKGDYIYNPFEGKVMCMQKILSDEELEKKHKHSVRTSMTRTINKLYEYARSNDWDYFLTFTFNPDKVDRYDYQVVVEKLSRWLKNMKQRYCPDMRYLIVPEQHKDGAFHFHGLFSQIDNIGLVDSGKRVVSKKKVNGRIHFFKTNQIIYNVSKYSWGFTTATKIKDVRKASSYISKYITKDLCNNTFGKKRYWASRNLDLPDSLEYLISKVDKDNLKRILANHITYARTVPCEYGDTCYIEVNKCNESYHLLAEFLSSLKYAH